MNCQENGRKSWAICSDIICSQGMKFFTLCDKYSSAIFGYSVMGFYISIVFLAGRLFRSSISGQLELIQFMELPYPDNLIRICEAIVVARIEKDLIRLKIIIIQGRSYYISS